VVPLGPVEDLPGRYRDHCLGSAAWPKPPCSATSTSRGRASRPLVLWRSRSGRGWPQQIRPHWFGPRVRVTRSGGRSWSAVDSSVRRGAVRWPLPFTPAL